MMNENKSTIGWNWEEKVERFIIKPFLPIAISNFNLLMNFPKYFNCLDGADIKKWYSKKDDCIRLETIHKKVCFINEFGLKEVWDRWNNKSELLRSDETKIIYLIADKMYETSLLPLDKLLKNYDISENLFNDILFIKSKFFNVSLFNWGDEDLVVSGIKNSTDKSVEDLVDWELVFKTQKSIPAEKYLQLRDIKEKYDNDIEEQRMAAEKEKRLERLELSRESWDKRRDPLDHLWSKKKLREMDEFVMVFFDQYENPFM